MYSMNVCTLSDDSKADGGGLAPHPLTVDGLRDHAF